MSMKDCINRAVDAGLMDRDRAEQAKNLFDENYNQARLSLGEEESHAQARKATVDILKHKAELKRKQTLLQIARSREITDRIAASPHDAGRVVLAHLDFDEGVHGVPNISKRKESIRGVFHQEMSDFLAKHRRNLIGQVREKADLEDIVRELNGQSTGNVYAAEMAKAWSNVAEMARKMFNEAGGDIPKLEGWGLPQSHDMIAVRNAGFDAWYQFVAGKLDLQKMTDYSTGQAFTELRLKEAMRSVYDDITTEGWAGRAAGTNYGQKLANRRTDHRFFIFKSADDWMEYHHKFGQGDIFSVMMGHLDGMARDIAELQIFGPNPSLTVRWMADLAEKDYRSKASRQQLPDDRLESKAKQTRLRLEQMYEHYKGSVSSPINGRLARNFASTRSILQSAQLGGAALSAFSDLGFGKMAADHVGMQYRNVLARQVSLLNPLNIEDQKIAVRLGLIAENWSTLAMAQQRYLGEVTGNEVSQRMADFVMRASGLSPWTQAGRWAFGMEFSGMLADHANHAFKDLPDAMQKTFERAGVSSNDWNIARQTPKMYHKGAEFLRPDDIVDKDIAMKFLDMIHTETEYAVPSTSLRGRSMLIGDAKPGTAQGELIRSFAMYKNFAMTLMFTHYRRIANQNGKYNKGKYIAKLMIYMGLAGGMALQMKEISKGRDPRDMTDLDFWGAAILQGGGLGIFGDFLTSSKNRYDKGLAETLAGPVAGLAGDVLGSTTDIMTRIWNGEDQAAGRELVALSRSYTPGLSLWYLRLAMDRFMFDELSKMADPKATSRARRMERKYAREKGQKFWSSPSTGKTRLPDLSAAFGQ